MKKKTKPVDRLFNLTFEPGTGLYAIHYQSPDVSLHLCFKRDSEDIESLIQGFRQGFKRFPGLGEILVSAAALKDKQQDENIAPYVKPSKKTKKRMAARRREIRRGKKNQKPFPPNPSGTYGKKLKVDMKEFMKS